MGKAGMQISSWLGKDTHSLQANNRFTPSHLNLTKQFLGNPNPFFPAAHLFQSLQIF